MSEENKINFIEAVNYMSENENNICIGSTGVEYRIEHYALVMIDNEGNSKNSTLVISEFVNKTFTKKEIEKEEVYVKRYKVDSENFKKSTFTYRKGIFESEDLYTFIHKDQTHKYFSSDDLIFKVKI